MDGVRAEVQWQLVSRALEIESTLANAARPRQHGIASPGDHRLVVFIVADEVIDAAVADLRDAPTGLRCDGDAQLSIGDGSQRPRLHRRRRIQFGRAAWIKRHKGR